MQRTYYSTSFTVLPAFNIILLKHTRKINSWHIYIYNDFFFYKIDEMFKTIDVTIDKETNSIIFKHLSPIISTYKVKNLFKGFFFSLDNYYFEKLKFTGKGYRIIVKKRKKRMKFKFGHSHKKLIFFRNLKLNKYHKYKFVVFSNNKNNVLYAALLVANVKLINLYTRRGLRRSRQVIYWKKSQKLTN